LNSGLPRHASKPGGEGRGPSLAIARRKNAPPWHGWRLRPSSSSTWWRSQRIRRALVRTRWARRLFGPLTAELRPHRDRQNRQSYVSLTGQLCCRAAPTRTRRTPQRSRECTRATTAVPGLRIARTGISHLELHGPAYTGSLSGGHNLNQGVVHSIHDGRSHRTRGSARRIQGRSHRAKAC